MEPPQPDFVQALAPQKSETTIERVAGPLGTNEVAGAALAAVSPAKNAEEDSDEGFSIEKSHENVNSRKSSLKEEFLSASALQSKAVTS